MSRKDGAVLVRYHGRRVQPTAAPCCPWPAYQSSTSAYSKLLRHHLGVSLQKGEISDLEMRRILVQAIYLSHRDWIFRPQS